MRYKIFKIIERSYKLNISTQLYELLEVEKCYVKRKGRIFGFWYDVGEILWSSGGSFIALKYFDSIDQAISYIKCWHKTNYKNDNYKIDNEISYE